jgi:hypothetical protein
MSLLMDDRATKQKLMRQIQESIEVRKEQREADVYIY